ncbi:MAG: thioesterase family protein [Nocardioidaceae bacterium]|nr:thioesterase family protein [Nocardioidaceae bacterium]
MSGHTTGLVELLDLKRLDDYDWLATADGMRLPQLFGGQLIAQSVVAAGRAAGPGTEVHSIHTMFLRPGAPDTDVRLTTTPLRVGRQFQAFRVQAWQGQRLICESMVSATVHSEGLAHQRMMPVTQSPEDSIDLGRLAEADGGLAEIWDGFSAIEMRVAQSTVDDVMHSASAPDNIWMRSREPLPDDPLLHRAVMAYASDLLLMTTALAPHGITTGQDNTVMQNWLPISLDHSIRFHTPCPADDWLLFEQTTPVAHASRALVTAAVFDEGGRPAGHVSQETFIRPRHDVGAQ